MIELVPDCRPLCEIHSSQGATGVFKDDILNNWLIKNNPSEFQYKAVCDNIKQLFCLILRHLKIFNVLVLAGV